MLFETRRLLIFTLRMITQALGIQRRRPKSLMKMSMTKKVTTTTQVKKTLMILQVKTLEVRSMSYSDTSITRRKHQLRSWRPKCSLSLRRLVIATSSTQLRARWTSCEIKWDRTSKTTSVLTQRQVVWSKRGGSLIWTTRTIPSLRKSFLQ